MPRLEMLLAVVLLGLLCSCGAQLQVGFYQNDCPDAENIVKSAVAGAFQFNRAIAPQLLRLHFHDCIVDGCDGSILINSPDGQQENRAFGHQGLGGFQVIDDAKAQLEAQCPGVVSCADIVALAARDSVVLTNGPFYEVETGRRDGFVSSIGDAQDLPDVSDSVDVLIRKFSAKGLSATELILLSAAHTIGTTACFFMPNRLFNFHGTGRPDPSIPPPFLARLQRICPNGGNVNVRLAMDEGSEFVFDNQILVNIRAGTAVLESDAAAFASPVTRPIVEFYARSPASFLKDFPIAMLKMGRLGALTGSDGEVRNFCSSFN